MTVDIAQGRVRLFVVFALVLLSLTQIGVSGYSWVMMREALRPEMDRKARIVAVTMAERVGRAVAQGIPLDRLEGVEAYFDHVLASNPDIGWIGLDTAQGVRFAAGQRPGTATKGESKGFWSRLLSEGDRLSQAIRPVPGAGDAQVIVAANPAFVRDQLRGVLFDLSAVMLVSLFIAFEFICYAFNATLTGPLEVAGRLIGAIINGRLDQTGEEDRGPAGPLIARLNARVLRLNQMAGEIGERADDRLQHRLAAVMDRFRFAGADGFTRIERPRLIDARLLTFLFMFAEGLIRPFLPVYVKGFQTGAIPVPSDLAAGLPIVAFMLVVALGMPWAGGFSERRGRRSGFLIGAALSAVGLAGSGLAFSFVDLMLWRVVDGLGCAMMLMAGQGFALDHTPRERRAEGMAVYIGGIMAAEICAPALGGILADRIGDRATFLLAGTLTALTFVSALGSLRRGTPVRVAAPPRGQGGLAAMLLRNPRFLVLTVCAGFPAKMALIGFLFYLVPLLATDLGAGSAYVGRIAMLYGALTLFLMPVFSRLADRWKLHGLMVGAGGLIAGLGMLPILFRANLDSLLIGVFALGVGQAMSISPQVTLAAKLTNAEIARYGHEPVLGVYRLIERCGSACGPIVYGLLAATLGYADAMALGGMIAAGLSLLFCIVFLIVGIEPEDDDLTGEAATDVFGPTTGGVA